MVDHPFRHGDSLYKNITYARYSTAWWYLKFRVVNAVVKARKKCWAEANIDKMSGAMGTFPPIYFPSYSTRSIWKVIQKMMPWYSVPIPYGFPPCGIHNAIKGPHLYIKNSKGLCSKSFQENLAIPTSSAPKKMGMVTMALWFPTINIKVYIYNSFSWLWLVWYFFIWLLLVIYPLRTFKNHIDGIRPWLLWIPHSYPTDRH